MSGLCIKAGSAVIDKIRQEGLPADTISAVFGASGAAKWLTICGLDQAIFGRYLTRSEQPIDLFGTSVGAFKLAAAVQEDCEESLARFAESYIEQDYTNGATRDDIGRETLRIISGVLANGGGDRIIHHPRYRFHCAAVRCRGLLASEGYVAQRLGMIRAALLAMGGRQPQAKAWQRVVFGAADSLPAYSGADGFHTDSIILDETNIARALQASGSIPMMMYGVAAFGANDAGCRYRDGGIIDYHPLPDNIRTPNDGVVLYPHFYSTFTEGWFDQFTTRRKVTADRLRNVVMIAPSDAFVASLPGGAIPNRKDFLRLKHDPALREAQWREAVARSVELGDEFLSLIDSGNIASVVRPF